MVSREEVTKKTMCKPVDFFFFGACSAGSDVKSTGIVSTAVQDFYAWNTTRREAPVTYHRDSKGLFLICNFVIDRPVIFGIEDVLTEI